MSNAAFYLAILEYRTCAYGTPLKQPVMIVPSITLTMPSIMTLMMLTITQILRNICDWSLERNCMTDETRTETMSATQTVIVPNSSVESACGEILQFYIKQCSAEIISVPALPGPSTGSRCNIIKQTSW